MYAYKSILGKGSSVTRKERKAWKSWQKVCTLQNKIKVNFLCNELTNLIRKIKNECSKISCWTYCIEGHRLLVENGELTENTEDPLDSTQAGGQVLGKDPPPNLFVGHLEENVYPLPRQIVEESKTRIFVSKFDSKDIQKVMLQELRNEIKNNLNAKKAKGMTL